MKNKLTEKCKEHFYNWYEENAHVSKFNKTRNVTIVHFIAQSETCQNALIIDFFDSVGIYITVDHNVTVSKSFWCNSVSDSIFNSRTEATNAAIEKANEIFLLR